MSIVSDIKNDKTHSFCKLNFQKNVEIDIKDSIDTSIAIIKNILSITSSLNSKNQNSVFEINQKQFSETDSESSDNDSENDEIISKMEIDEFIERIINYLKIDKTLLVLSMMMLDKILANNFILTERNVHKVIFICFMETQKFFEDENYKNSDYAKVCGISVNELLLMEVSFMELINYNMFVKEEEYIEYNKTFEGLWKY
jgi:hypothetical protein